MKINNSLKKPDLDEVFFKKNMLDGKSFDAFDAHLKRLFNFYHGKGAQEPMWNHYNHKLHVVV